jgi:hypothetical protein
MGWDPDGPGATAGETAELHAEIERLRAALQRVAEQKTQEEVGEDGLDSSDVCWEEGFDALVLIAREALNQQETSK